jgi:hypothetical protein
LQVTRENPYISPMLGVNPRIVSISGPPHFQG